MLLRDATRQLLRDLRSQKLRTTLTVFGLVWGTVAVTLLLAFGQGLHRRLIKATAGLGDRIAIAWPGLTSIPFEGLGRGRAVRVSAEDVAAVRARAAGVRAVSAEFSDSLKAAVGPKTLSVDVSGVEPSFGAMRNLIPKPGGRFLNPLDLERRRRVVFIGDRLATDLFGDPAPVGRELLLHGSPFTVVGVLEPKDQDSSYRGRDHSIAFIPATTFRAITGAAYVDNLVYQPTSPARSAEATAGVRAVLAERLRFDPADEEALTVWDTTEQFAFMDVFFMSFNLFLGVVGSLTLVVGGIGVSNVMNVVVEERTREIGVKLALGARQRRILGQILAETLLLTAAGGAIGFAITAGICLGLAPRLGLEEAIGTPVLSPAVAALTVGILGLVGALAGYFPARDAARLDPVVAMKA